MSEKFSSGTKNPNHTNNHTNKQTQTNKRTNERTNKDISRVYNARSHFFPPDNHVFINILHVFIRILSVCSVVVSFIRKQGIGSGSCQNVSLFPHVYPLNDHLSSIGVLHGQKGRRKESCVYVSSESDQTSHTHHTTLTSFRIRKQSLR